MSVAVIIPTLNRQSYVASLLYQRGAYSAARNVTAIVVDQSPNPWRCRAESLVYVHCPHLRGAGLSRNIGIGIALGMGVEFLCFWDDDDMPTEDYIEVMHNAILSDPYASLSACLIEHEGKARPRKTMSTASRMIRASQLYGARWDGKGSGTDRRFWSEFDRLHTVYVDRVLYRTGNAQTGGLRDPTGEF